jgi:hypothetical protein
LDIEHQLQFDHGYYSAHTTTADVVPNVDNWMQSICLGSMEQAKFWNAGKLCAAHQH